MNNKALMLEELRKINTRLSEIENGIADLREGQDEIRFSVNRLVEWADECSSVFELPLPKI